jgi:PIN domain nuclease of toxin-antitoxin system
MKLLLDTHTFIWLESKPANLSAKAKTALQDTNNSLLLSVASVWEMQIKLQLSKLTLSLPLPQVIATQQEVNGIEILPVTLAHALALANLPITKTHLTVC